MTIFSAGNRAEVNSIVEGLGAPTAGTRRVFRGQTRAYSDDAGQPLLLPAVVRPKGTKTYDPAWLVSVQMYLGQKSTGEFDVTGDLQHLWAPALLQHYGPGSSYLDVTADIDMALWFSFAKLNMRTVAVPMDGLVRNVECAWHTELPQPWDEADGPVIYVLDSPVWNGEGVPKHGESVDLLAMGAGILPEEATRLKRQTASLVYVDVATPSLDASLRAVIRLAPDFDRPSVPTWGRTTHDVFPQPSEDPFYRTLLNIPAQPLVEDPKTFRNPLSIPCYLSVPDKAVPDSSEVEQYAAFGPPIHPPLCHAFLLTSEAAETGGPVAVQTDDGECLYQFKDATPFLLEAPLWIVTASIKTPRDAGDWIPSALPLGIATEIAERPTDSVYVEFSGLDHYYPTRTGRDESQTYVRAVWLVRCGHHYVCTVYAVTEGELFSYRVEYRFINSRGVFGRVPWPREDEADDPESFRSFFWMAQKGLFVTLMLLRDLSPGFKPPSTFSVTAEDKDGNVKERFLGTLLEPQLGQAKPVPSSPYLVPKALNGTAWVRASGAPVNSSEDWRTAPGGFEALLDAFQHVRDPHYTMEAGLELAEWLRGCGETRHALHVVDTALSSAALLPESEFARKLETMLHSLRGRLGIV